MNDKTKKKHEFKERKKKSKTNSSECPKLGLIF